MASAKLTLSPCRLKDESFDDSFHRLLGRLVHTVARLDFNVGLQLRFWGLEGDPKIQDLLQARTSKLNARLKALKRLLDVAWADAGSEGLQAMSAWFSRADQARAFRNEYAHGRWGVPGGYLQADSGRQCDATPLLLFVPLDWNMSPDRPDESISLTLEAFAAQVNEAELLAEEYRRLTEKYAGNAYTGHRLS